MYAESDAAGFDQRLFLTLYYNYTWAGGPDVGEILLENVLRDI